MRLIDHIMAAASNPISLLLTATDNKTRKAHGASLRVMARDSKRYFIDEETTEVATRLGIEHPEILNQLLKKARPLQDRMWIEWHNHTFIQQSGERARDDAPEFAGCFIETVDSFYPIYRITISGRMPNSNKIVVSPLSYVYRTDDQPMPTSEDMPYITRTTGYTEEYFRHSTLGTAYVAARGKAKTMPYPESYFADLRIANLMGHCTTEMTPLTRKYLQTTNNVHVREYLRSDAVESAGTWRLVFCLLSMLSARDYVQTTPSPRKAKTTFASGKMVPFIEHQTVSLKLPRKVVYQRIVKDCAHEIAIGRRQHDVDGYWCTSHQVGDPKCDHAYVDETPNRHVCVFCGNKRWHVRAHKRGNPQIGILIKDRQVMISD